MSVTLWVLFYPKNGIPRKGIDYSLNPHEELSQLISDEFLRVLRKRQNHRCTRLCKLKDCKFCNRGAENTL